MRQVVEQCSSVERSWDRHLLVVNQDVSCVFKPRDRMVVVGLDVGEAAELETVFGCGYSFMELQFEKPAA